MLSDPIPYLDCNATSPLSSAAREAMLPWLEPTRPANAGSRTHGYGGEALRAVNAARAQVAAVAELPPAAAVLTSGATEANNLAILGLAEYGREAGRTHIVTSAIEHKAVLEPIEQLERQGFAVTRVRPDGLGRLDASEVLAAVREDTLLVSIMAVNNESGTVQPIEAIGDGLGDETVLLHTDAAQSYAKHVTPLRHPRVDMMSVSGHKIGGPIGIGALLLRKRRFRAPPLRALIYGGGQERKLRAGTLPTMLIVGFGAAAASLDGRRERWWASCERYREDLLAALDESPLDCTLNMSVEDALPNCVNLGFQDGGGRWVDSETVLLTLKDVVAASNGSACTSASIEPSHVLVAQGLPEARVRAGLRFSWTEGTARVDRESLREALGRLR